MVAVYLPDGRCSTVTDFSFQSLGMCLCWRTASHPIFGSFSLLALSSSPMLPPMRLVVYAAFPRRFDLYLGNPLQPLSKNLRYAFSKASCALHNAMLSTSRRNGYVSLYRAGVGWHDSHVV